MNEKTLAAARVVGKLLASPAGIRSMLAQATGDVPVVVADHTERSADVTERLFSYGPKVILAVVQADETVDWKFVEVIASPGATLEKLREGASDVEIGMLSASFRSERSWEMPGLVVRDVKPAAK